MPARTPEEVHELLAEAFSAGDVEALVSLYEPEATLMPRPGQTVSGHAAIREALGGFLAVKGQFRLTTRSVIRAHEVALLLSDSSLAGTDPEGNAVDTSSRTSDVVRRQPDGRWLLVIDNPYGSAAAGD